MTEADPAKIAALQAAEKAEDAAYSLVPVTAEITDIGVQLNTALRAANDAIRKTLTVIAQIQQAKMLTDTAIAGTQNRDVTQAIQWLSKVEQDQKDNLTGLSIIKDQIEAYVKNALPALITVNEENASFARGAASYLRAYGNIL